VKQGVGVISGDYMWLYKNGLTVHNREFERCKMYLGAAVAVTNEVCDETGG
jgi:hypothetical protein